MKSFLGLTGQFRIFRFKKVHFWRFLTIFDPFFEHYRPFLYHLSKTNPYNKHNHSSSAYFEIPLLTVENFCFDIDVDHTNKREPNLNVFTRVSADVTRNQEAMPIPGYVKTLWEKAYHAPPTLNYISTQKPTNEVFSGELG